LAERNPLSQSTSAGICHRVQRLWIHNLIGIVVPVQHGCDAYEYDSSTLKKENIK